jgi:hypothetical protein
MALDLTQFISEIRTAGAWEKIAPRLGPMFQNIQDAINQAAKASGVDSTQHTSQPNPPAKLSVKTAGELAHVTIEDNSARTRARNYFLEYSNKTSFSPANTYTEHLGVGRHKVLNLPTNDDNGKPHNWYFRTYSMEPGSKKASAHVVYGVAGAPTAVTMGGTTNLSLLPSTGAGTAPSNGQKAGQGFGTPQVSKETIK